MFNPAAVTITSFLRPRKLNNPVASSVPRSPVESHSESRGCTLPELPLAEMQAVEPAITKAVYRVLDVERSVASRSSFGGTAPERVREAIAAARKRYPA